MHLSKGQAGILRKTPGTSEKAQCLLLWWDVNEEGKRFYNRYAFGQYLAALERAEHMVDNGSTWAHAINTSFCGRLLAYLNKHLSLGINDNDLNH